MIAKEEKESFIATFVSGLKYLKTMPEFLIVIGVAVIANFALGPIFSVALPVVILNDFGLSETVYGVIASLMTAGMMIGPLFASGIIKKYHYSKLVTVILSLSGILCFMIAGSSIKGIFPNIYYNTLIMVVLINILMIIIIWVNLALATARQRIVPGNLQGRVYSVIGMLAMIAMPLGQITMGSLLDVTESYIIIGIFAVLILISGILAKVGFASLDRKGKMYKEPEEGRAETAAETA